MAKAESTSRGGTEGLNVDFMRSLVKQYSELGLWTSALFWADAAAAAGSGTVTPSGDDVWLLASAMLARGEYNRAAYTVTSRGLHKHHLLCLGVAMRAHLAAQEGAAALALLEDTDPALLQPRPDHTHNRALAGVLVSQARALSSLERRDAAAEALCSALRADCACVEAVALLHRQRALTHQQEIELLDSLPISSQLGAAEGALLRAAYRDRAYRYSTPPRDSDPVASSIEQVRARTAEAATSLARRRAATCDWAGALKALDAVDPWCAAPVRAACLVELKRSAELFAFAHTLVDAYPNSWTSWFAVGCYYYLIGKNELARRYLSKAKSLEPGAGCAWLVQGHSFTADNEHDQAMAAYFKASQLMAGSHLPPLYVGVECALLNNFTMCERFLLRAATLHSSIEAGEEEGWATIARVAREPHVAHEAGAAAFAAGQPRAARELWLAALRAVPEASTLGTPDQGGWETIARVAREPHVAHEAGAAAFAAGQPRAARELWLAALRAVPEASTLGTPDQGGWETIARVAREPHVAHEAGAAAFAAGQPRAARELWLAALRAVPEASTLGTPDQGGWETIARVAREPHVAHEAGAAAFAAGQPRAARELWLAALRAVPEASTLGTPDQGGWETIARVAREPHVAHEAGAAAFAAGQPRAARELWLAALRAVPEASTLGTPDQGGWETIARVAREPHVAHEAGAAAFAAGQPRAARELWLAALRAVPEASTLGTPDQGGWETIARVAREPHVAHEAGAAAFAAGQPRAARELWLAALRAVPEASTLGTPDQGGWETIARVAREPHVAHEAGAAAFAAGQPRAARELWLAALRAVPEASTLGTPDQGGWETIARVAREPHVAHEAGAAAFAAGQPRAARELWLAALRAVPESENMHPRWAATLDALGHACRKLGQIPDALAWHERALALRPGRAATYAARGLCLALLARERDAADALHAALSKDPDDVVSLALLDAIVDRLDAALTEEEIPAFPFGPVEISGPPGAGGGGGGAPPAGGDATQHSDMSMSFELSVTGND